MNRLIEITFFRKAMELICLLLGLVNQIIPKNKSKIIFFNSKSDYLNNYALYRYMIEKKYNEKYLIYYCMPEIGKSEKKAKNVFFIESSIQTVLLYLTSQYCFFDTGNMRIKPAKNQKVINLWHGTPLKRIGFMSHSAEKSLPKNMMNTFTSICVSASAFDDIYVKSFNLKKEQIIHMAQPRLDDLTNTKNALGKLGVDKNKYNKVIMWMTTYRISKDGRLHHTSKQIWNETNLPIISDFQKVNCLNSFLKSENVYLLIKIHRTSIFNKDSIPDLSNIRVIIEEDFIPKGVQLYEILGECDALITDYSSVYFDYLILDRPICFIIEDIDEYNKINGFTIEEPTRYMPGPQIDNMDELKKFCVSVSEGKDAYRIKRKEVCDWCNEYVCTENSKYLLDSVGIVREKNI